jgi:hypothetical protein
VRDFRANRGGARDFFADPRPGPKTAPGKDAARARIIELRAQGHSIDEIGTVLAREGVALNRTGINEVITEAGLPRIWRRRDAARGGPRREDLPRARALADEDYPDVTGQLTGGHPTRLAGLLLALPDLLALDLPGLVDAAGYPGTRDIPAISYLLSLLALKLTATRRVSHVHDVAGDPAAALFTGLTALPKTTACSPASRTSRGCSPRSTRCPGRRPPSPPGRSTAATAGSPPAPSRSCPHPRICRSRTSTGSG